MGLVVPSLLLGVSPDGHVDVAGPSGRIRFSPGIDTSTLWAGIVSVGGVLTGPETYLRRAAHYLKAERSSRTFSYVCTVARDCVSAVRSFERFSKARVVILGCGGIGSLSAMLLAGAGMRHLTIVDDDRIESSNLNRQLFFTRADLGKSKVDVVKEAVAERFPDVAVEAVKARVSAGNLAILARRADAILHTIDNPIEITRSVRRYARTSGVALVSAGYSVSHAMVTSERASLPGLDRGVEWMRIPHGIMPSFGPTNAELAGQATTLLFHLLAGFTAEGLTYTCGWSGHGFPRTYLVSAPGVDAGTHARTAGGPCAAS